MTNSTHVMDCDSPRLVAVATGGFFCAPEQQVSEVYLITHLKEEELRAMGLKVEVLVCLSEENLFITKMTDIFSWRVVNSGCSTTHLALTKTL